MAVVLDAFVGRCLKMLKQLLTEEVVTMLGVKDDLQRLQERLEMIEDVLYDAERKRIQDAAVNRWLSKLRDVMYDADDIIDLCKINGHQLLQGQSSTTTLIKRRRLNPISYVKAVFTCVTKSISLRHEVGEGTKKLNERLEEISKDTIMFSLQHNNSPNVALSQVNTRQTSPLPCSDHVGRQIEVAADTLVNSLLNSEGESLLVFAIVGLGGIGKTTLAQKIYNHQKVQTNFEKKMWVCVSQNYSETELLKQVIRGAGGGEHVIYAQTKAELQPLLSSTLTGKRFLLVLDDVWREDVWEYLLRSPLEHAGMSGSRVVITTRNEDVARSMRAMRTHQVKKLSAKDGWALLYKSVFNNGDDEDDIHDFHEIGRQIIEKCDGLPLAIKAIAGVLRTRDKCKGEWEKVYKSHAWSISGDLPETVRGALYLSYEDLPSQLKQCFLYCSLFPEDYVFDRSELIQFWLAEGFITKQGDSLLEDIAEECYNSLISRSLLHLHPLVLDGSLCTMHDLTRSLALFLAQDESYFIGINGSTFINSVRPRRLAIYDEEEKAATLLNAIENPQCLRTLHTNRCLHINLIDLSQRFRHLRVLNLTGSKIERIPDSLQNLLHLRYLDLDGSTVREIPDSLGCLTNLQFLNLSSCKFLHTLPNSITQLCNLRCLGLIETPVSHVPTGIGKLEHLVYLKGFVVGEDEHNSNIGDYRRGCGLDELQTMSGLRYLIIDRLERVLTVGIQPLKDKFHLKVLDLKCSKDVDQYSFSSARIEQIYEDLCPPPSLEHLVLNFYYGLNFPKWMGVLSNLTMMYLYYCSSCTQLPPLGQLPQLRILKIEGLSSVVTIGTEFLGCDIKDHSGTPTVFPKLEELMIRSMPNWEEWVFDPMEEEEVVKGGIIRRAAMKFFPHLGELFIIDCPKLTALADGLQLVSSLKSCCIDGADSLREIKNLLSLEDLQVYYSEALESISNLPTLREMQIVYSCTMLNVVVKLDTLQCLAVALNDDCIDCLPEWLLGLIPELKTEGGLQTLALLCNKKLRERCIQGGQYWPLLSNVPNVLLQKQQ